MRGSHQVTTVEWTTEETFALLQQAAILVFDRCGLFGIGLLTSNAEPPGTGEHFMVWARLKGHQGSQGKPMLDLVRTKQGHLVATGLRTDPLGVHPEGAQLVQVKIVLWVNGMKVDWPTVWCSKLRVNYMGLQRWLGTFIGAYIKSRNQVPLANLQFCGEDISKVFKDLNMTWNLILNCIEPWPPSTMLDEFSSGQASDADMELVSLIGPVEELPQGKQSQYAEAGSAKSQTQYGTLQNSKKHSQELSMLQQHAQEMAPGLRSQSPGIAAFSQKQDQPYSHYRNAHGSAEQSTRIASNTAIQPAISHHVTMQQTHAMHHHQLLYNTAVASAHTKPDSSEPQQQQPLTHQAHALWYGALAQAQARHVQARARAVAMRPSEPSSDLERVMGNRGQQLLVSNAKLAQDALMQALVTARKGMQNRIAEQMMAEGDVPVHAQVQAQAAQAAVQANIARAMREQQKKAKSSSTKN